VVKSAPRELPSVGVRQDGKGTVLGLHTADDITKAACGWYRVVPASAPSNQVVVARSYTLKDGSAVESLRTAARPARPTPIRDQIAAIRAVSTNTAAAKLSLSIDAIAAELDRRGVR
jgi:hypothetical protein